MTPASSTSEAAKPGWNYIRTGPGRSGRSLAENNFAKERRDWLSILLREILQNALDARKSDDIPVTVDIQHRAIEGASSSFVADLIGTEHLARFTESVPHIQAAPPSGIGNCLIVEDFGTTGLTGVLDDPDADGKGQNWNAFFFREGEGGKENTSGNGGAGQGKITYFSTSVIRTIFAYTVREGDLSEALIGASSFLRDYQDAGHKWKRDSYWGLTTGEGLDCIHLPVQERVRIDEFRKRLGLKRHSSDTGLSLVIPSPKDVSMADAVQIVIAEFFVPIVRGDLVVSLGETRLDKSSIVATADSLLSDDRARELHTCTTREFRTFMVEAVTRSRDGPIVVAKPFDTASQLSEATFEAADLQAMRDDLEQQKLVSVRFPVMVKSRKVAAQQCFFDVHLVCPYELEHPEQAVIRRDLLIGEEPIGAGKLRQSARGLTIISDRELSRLLLSAEEATHLRWNTRLPRLGEYYRSGPEVVAVVRNAMAKLLDVLTGGEQKRDFKLLSKYFSAPGTSPAARAKGRKSPKGKLPPVPGPIPPPSPRLLTIEALVDGCRIRPARPGALEEATMPMAVAVEFAYEGLDKDAFSEYDPMDFDLADPVFAVHPTGCTVSSRDLNRIEFSIDSKDFEFALSGFDTNLRLRMRLNYKEADDATAVDAQ